MEILRSLNYSRKSHQEMKMRRRKAKLSFGRLIALCSRFVNSKILSCYARIELAGEVDRWLVVRSIRVEILSHEYGQILVSFCECRFARQNGFRLLLCGCVRYLTQNYHWKHTGEHKV